MKIYLIYFLSIYGIPPSVMTEYDGKDKKTMFILHQRKIVKII